MSGETVKRTMKFAGMGTAIVCGVVASLVGAVPASAAEAPDPLLAVAEATPATVAAAANVPTTETGALAVDATVADIQVAIPVDPALGISVGTGSTSVAIGLPFASTANDATTEKAGVVSYDNKNGSTTVPVVQRDGTVQINTVISGAASPKRFDYPISVPAGHTLRLEASGAVSIGDGNGSLSALIAAAWAKDANGDSVPTHYEVQGNTLTQVVDFTAATAFPVVADPSVSWLWWGRTVKYTKSETKQVASFASNAQMFSYLCLAGGLAGAACTTVANLGLQIVKNAATNASRAGRCLQLNIPHVGPGLLYDVTC